jgi:hypothetical protein
MAKDKTDPFSAFDPFPALLCCHKNRSKWIFAARIQRIMLKLT